MNQMDWTCALFKTQNKGHGASVGKMWGKFHQ